MVETHYCCPDCGSIDMEISGQGILSASGDSTATATCPNCAWKGPLADTLGLATTETLWTVERIGELMIRLMGVHAAGPMVQAYEHVGLIPREVPEDENLTDNARADHNEMVQAIRNRVMTAIVAAAIEAGFTEAAICSKLYAISANKPLHPVLRETSPVVGRTFGGDVVDIESARKKNP